MTRPSVNEFDYINRTYGMNVGKGVRVEYTGNETPQQGTIIGVDGPYLRIRMDGSKNVMPYHPTWELRVL
jgi:hypothetical protein